MPGLGTLQTVAGFLGDKTGDAVQGLKQIAINKGILPNDKLDSTTGTTAVVSGPAYDPAGLEGYRDAIMQMNQTRSPLEGFVPNPQDMGIAAQPGRFVQNPQDMNIQPKMSAQDYYKDLSPAELNFLLGGRNPAGMFGTDYAIPMNEGGLASINNPEYNMLMNASNFAV